jgi:aerobic-type carbon monoxide dehydrogenase small subunit (CoxS/CutS family)
MRLELQVNGRATVVETHPAKRLLDVLREECGLTGTKEGCGEGECGACTVLLDGQPVMSCLVPACQVAGRRLTTIEGLAAPDGTLHAMQAAFAREGGTQCGICTPGMILAAVAWARDPASAADAGEALAGNLCRCTGYTRIFTAVASALEQSREANDGTAR